MHQHPRQSSLGTSPGPPRCPQHREGTTPSHPPGIPRLAGTEVRMALLALALAPSHVAKKRTQLVN